MHWLSPPVFEGDEEKTRIARILNSIVIAVLLITSVGAPFMILSSEPANRLPLIVLLIPTLLLDTAALILIRRGYVTAASYIFLLFLGTAILGSYAVSEPGSAGALVGLTIIIAYTNVLLGARAVFRLTAFIVAFMLVVTFGQLSGWIIPIFTNSTDPIGSWISSSLTLVLTALGIYLSSVSLKQALDNSLASRKKTEATNRELAELQKALEQRVSERTIDLEKRATQLQLVSSVARKIATVQDTHILLPEITKLVSEAFGFYHTGIFLIDDNNEFAILQAANSEGGKRMLARQHKLALNLNSLVGYAASLGEPRVALDVGRDAVYVNNPDLPDTRSEMSLPLRIGGQVIGVLDVQSTHTNAFAMEDISVLTVLADQVAIAIENSRLFSESKNALSTSQSMFEKYVRQEWSNFGRQAKHSGFVYDGKHVAPVNVQDKREQAKRPAQTGSLSLDKSTANISVPIKLRGQVIGVLDVRPKKGQRQWTQDELAMLEAAAERAALALENARLVESAQRRAARERAIGEISAKIGAVSDKDLILQAAVEGLGRKIGNTEIIIELESENQ